MTSLGHNELTTYIGILTYRRQKLRCEQQDVIIVYVICVSVQLTTDVAGPSKYFPQSFSSNDEKKHQSATICLWDVHAATYPYNMKIVLNRYR